MKYFGKQISRKLVRIKESAFLYIVIVLAVVLFLETLSSTIPFLVNKYEDVSFALFPSAQKAYDYGVVHFNASDPSDYNIDLASDYFYTAAALNPKLPYLWHELARISFIEGDFIKAMTQINIQIAQEGDNTPSSYYVRGLIEGFMGDYPAAEDDYAHFYQLVPINWAGANDYAWVLLKDGKPQMAAQVVESVLPYYPQNPWLLNSDAIALSEMGDATTARERLETASQSVADLTPLDWSIAYPGNDPNVASQGLAQFKQAVQDNIHTLDEGKAI